MRDLGCELPPEGWWCSREPGHDGPCAARPGSPAWEGPYWEDYAMAGAVVVLFVIEVIVVAMFLAAW